MNHSTKGSSKLKMGMTLFILLLTSAGAGVYADVTPNSITSNTAVLNNEWCRPKASEKKESALSLHPVKSDAEKSETSRHSLRRLHNKKQTEAQEFSNTKREQLHSPSDSNKKKVLVMLLLWSTKP